MNKRDGFRNQLKEVYRGNRKIDALIGRRLSELLCIWVSAKKTIKEVDGKRTVETTAEAQEAVEEAKSIRSETRFREDFPTFSSFYKFVKKEGLSVRDLLEG